MGCGPLLHLWLQPCLWSQSLLVLMWHAGWTLGLAQLTACHVWGSIPCLHSIQMWWDCAPQWGHGLHWVTFAAACAHCSPVSNSKVGSSPASQTTCPSAQPLPFWHLTTLVALCQQSVLFVHIQYVPVCLISLLSRGRAEKIYERKLTCLIRLWSSSHKVCVLMCTSAERIQNPARVGIRCRCTSVLQIHQASYVLSVTAWWHLSFQRSGRDVRFLRQWQWGIPRDHGPKRRGLTSSLLHKCALGS